nr:uncharcterized protein [uncultured bacterium]
MKISPNREQFILVMIMNGLFAFIVIVLAVESLISARDRVARTEPPPTSAARADKSPEKSAESKSAPSAVNVTMPHVEVKIPEALTKHAHPASAAKPGDARTEAPRAEAPKAPSRPPPMPVPGAPMQPPGPATFNPPTGMPPPPPRPSADEAPEKPLAGDNSFTVQLGAFSSEEKANALIARLAALKLDGRPIPVAQQPIKAGGRTMYRVRMGPFGTAQRARAAAALASRQAGVEGTVLGPGH